MGEFLDDEHFLTATYEAGVHVEQRKVLEELRRGKMKRKARAWERTRARAVKARERRRAPSKQGKLAWGARPRGWVLGSQATGVPRKKPWPASPPRNARNTGPAGRGAV